MGIFKDLRDAYIRDRDHTGPGQVDLQCGVCGTWFRLQIHGNCSPCCGAKGWNPRRLGGD